MRDCLLDTNIWSDWYKLDKNAYIIEKLKSISTARIHISEISWGELCYGYELLTQREKRKLGGILEFVTGLTPITLGINRHVSIEYGKLRAKLFNKYAPGKLRKKGMRPHELTDPCTDKQLQIQENDLWIASQAIIYDLGLVTNDKMNAIKEIAGKSFHIENWAAS